MLALCTFALLRLGVFLVHEDPLQQADAIFVLAGSQMDRPLEAVTLYRTGAAPIIVITKDGRDMGAKLIEKQGVHFPFAAELQRDVLVKLGVPSDAILVPARIHDNTAQEAETLHDLAVRRGWKRVIVVTSKYHTRRAGFAMRRELSRVNVDVVIRASRYDAADPARWWRHRDDIRNAALSETPKLVAYLLGLGG